MDKNQKNKSVICCMLLTFLVFVLNSCPVLGQVGQKKMLTKEQYAQWSTLMAQAISSHGNWTSYSVQYASEQDTLFVSRTDGGKTFTYPKGRRPMFANEAWFGCFNSATSMVLLSLTTGKEQRLENVVQFEFSSGGSTLVLASKKLVQFQDLRIIDLTTNVVTRIDSVTSFSYNQDFSALAYATRQEGKDFLKIVSLNRFLTPTLSIPLNGFVSKIVWQSNGQSVAFALRSSKGALSDDEVPTKLGYCILNQKKVYFLDPRTSYGFPKDKKIVLDYSDQLNISEDGQRILFQLAPTIENDSYRSSDVEVWHGADNHTYPERARDGKIEGRNTTWVWYPHSDTLLDFINNESGVLLSGNQKMVLSFDFESCGPEFKNHDDRDCYLTDLTNGIQKLILSCHSGHSFYTFMSPLGKYVAYFKDGNWFSYDVVNEVHRNLTKNASVTFYDEQDDKAGPQDVFIFVGWSKDDKQLYVYDQFDLWQISADGSILKRLTKGREKGIEYRLASETLRKRPESFLSLDLPTVIDLQTQLLLEATDYENAKHGFSVLKNGKVRELYFEPKNISMLLKSLKENRFVFIEETYEKAPRLVFKNNANEQCSTIFSSNKQQANYLWSFNKTLFYTTKSGQNLKGLLYYPANYVPGTLYPMIVNVYEQQYHYKHRYIPPSLLNSDGINITNFVMDGYFVFLPDIVYEVGSPGDSALDCVTAGVEAVLKLNMVDAKKIGLTGHSFGGYETTYIVGKSNLFATAVAGASQTDLVSCYLTSGEAYQKPEFWRFEEYSNRMGKMLFDDIDKYIYNSPIFNAPIISTPLLLWTGDKDGVVAPKQSMELYLALRRLKKEVVLLRYKDEYHSISNVHNQMDLTSKISNWFNYYLKDEPSDLWMKPNYNP